MKNQVEFKSENEADEEIVVVAKPAAATAAATTASADSFGSKKNCIKFKIEIEPGLFRRCYVPYDDQEGCTNHQDLYNRLQSMNAVHYYKDDANQLTIVDGADDIPGMLDVFQDQEVIQLSRFRPDDGATATKKRTREEEEGAAASDDDEEEGTLIRPTDLIKIICENEHKCLDIGGAAVREISSEVESKTTLLRIRRLDGPSEGLINSNHIVGLFSRDNKFRLDIGGASVYEECDADHDSWATLLHIRRAEGGDEEDERPLQYEELVGVFSSENDKRLDIGPNSMRMPCLAHHSSWATRLYIVAQDE